MYGLDIFSGIGGITKALEGYVRPVAYCENDRYAQCVLLSRMGAGDLPRAPIWDDVRTLKPEDLPAVDIIYGGFPCQDISIAGRGEGLAGKRSGLFFEIVRLVSEIRPRFVFLENVPAIRFRGGDVVAGELARLGYDCRWDCLSAYDVGAPHRRDRWWLLAANTKRFPVRDEPGRVGWESRESSPVSALDGDCRWRTTQPLLCRMDDGLPEDVDRVRALGNAVVPAQAREAFKRLSGLKEPA